MALTQEEMEQMPKPIEQAFSDLELKILEDIVARIKENNMITGTAEYDIFQLVKMGESEKMIKRYVEKTLKLTYSEIEDIFGDVFERGYNRDSNLYKAVGADFVAYKDNKQLQQFIGAIKDQTKGTYKNITNTMGFVRQREGVKTWVPLTKYYKDTLSRAVFEITSGAFSYSQVIKRTINEMTNSGIRTIDYASGRTSRIEVAARRAIMTAVTQVTAKVTEQNMEKLHTDYVEVSWHETARPTHQVWQGRVFKWNRGNGVNGKNIDTDNRGNYESSYIDLSDKYTNKVSTHTGEIEELQEYTTNGVTYKVDNINIKQNNSLRELQIAEILSSQLGEKVNLVPEICGIYKNVHAPDYLIAGERWDLKELKNGTSKNLIRDIVHKKREQAENFIFDITNSKLSDEEIFEQAEGVFTKYYNTKHAERVVIVKGDKIVKYLQKNREI